MRLWAHIVAWVALIVALVIAIRDGLSSLEQSALVIRPLGQIWYEIDRGSLNLVQAVVERYLTPALWDPLIVSFLQVPGVLAFGVIGLGFMALSYSRRGGRPLLRRKKKA